MGVPALAVSVKWSETGYHWETAAQLAAIEDGARLVAADLGLSVVRLQPGDLCLVLVDQVEEALAHLAKRVAEPVA